MIGFGGCFFLVGGGLCERRRRVFFGSQNHHSVFLREAVVCRISNCSKVKYTYMYIFESPNCNWFGRYQLQSESLHVFSVI